MPLKFGFGAVNSSGGSTAARSRGLERPNPEPPPPIDPGDSMPGIPSPSPWSSGDCWAGTNGPGSIRGNVLRSMLSLAGVTGSL